jgi:hypothetical protein
VLRCPAQPYEPQPGDIVFMTDYNPVWKILFNLAGTCHPHHSGIIVALPDGHCAVLESGPHDTLHVRLLEAVPHLCSYEEGGAVWIRRRRMPLTAEQSARLTEFAQRQDGKLFAGLRLAGQVTLFRSRGPLIEYLGGPHGERHSYFCSELLLESCVASGLLSAETTRPSATYPRDLFFDHSTNAYINRTLNLAESWYPPARWTSVPVLAPGVISPQ